MLWNRVITILLLAAAQLPSASAQQSTSAASPREQLQQLVTQLQANPSDDALRTKIIQLALTLQPPPAEPNDAHETAGAATYAFKNASSPDDCGKAGDLFAKASLAAPWVASLYYNQGLAYEKAKRYDDAIKAYHFYLMAAPGADGNDQVIEKIGGLKYAKGREQESEQRVQNEKTERENEERAWVREMEGEHDTTVRVISKDGMFGGEVYYVDTQFSDPYSHSPFIYVTEGEYTGDSACQAVQAGETYAARVSFLPSNSNLAPTAKVIYVNGHTCTGRAGSIGNGRTLRCPEKNSQWIVGSNGEPDCTNP